MDPKRDLDERVNPEADPAEFLAGLLRVDPQEDDQDGDADGESDE